MAPVAAHKVRWIVLIFAVALAMRLANSSLYLPAPAYRAFPSLDEIDYDSLARNLLHFGRFGTFTEGFWVQSMRPPVFPLFLASVYALGGHSLVAARVVQAVLDSANAVLVCALASSLGLAPVVSLAAGLCYALYGPTNAMCAFVTGEVFALFLLNLALLSLLRARGRRGVAWACLAALLVGLLIHVRPAFLGVIPFLVAALAWVAPKGERVQAAAVFCLVVLASLVPWGVRNYLVHQTFVPVSTAPAWHVAAACRGDQVLPIQATREYFFTVGRDGETAIYRGGVEIGMRSLCSHPLKFAAYGLARVVHSWGFPKWYDRFWRPRAYVVPIRVGSGFIPAIDFEGLVYLSAALAIVALARIRRIGPKLAALARAVAPIGFVVVGYALFHVFSIPLIQYRLMIEPSLLVMMIGFGACVLGVDPCSSDSPTQVPRWFVRWSWRVGLALAVVLGVLLPMRLMRIRAAVRNKERVMAELPSDQSGPTVGDVRRCQFDHRGDLGPLQGAAVCWVGEAMYAASGWRYEPVPRLEFSKPVACEGSTVFHLWVDRYKPEHPLGVGGVHVNVPTAAAVQLRDGRLVRVSGRLAGITCYGGLIVDAERVTDLTK